MNKKILVVLLLVLAVCLAALYFIKQKNLAPGGSEQAENFTVEKKDLPSNTLPKGFPADLPIPAGSAVRQNYEAVGSDGRVQSTRNLTVTQQSESALLKLYRDYFTKLGWTDYSENGKPTLLFRRLDDTVLVAVTSAATERMVEITLTQAAPKK